MSKKKITAPLSYDPGKGRPKEYLAYLNWQEMQALQRLNGGNMERGPMGLPSFPPDWRGNPNSTGNWSGAGGSVSPGAREGGGSDSGSRGSESASSAPGSADSARTAESQQRGSDATAQQDAANKNAAEAAKTSAFAEDARKAGIGSINVGPMQTPVKIGSGAISQAVSAYSAPYSSVNPTLPGPIGAPSYNPTIPDKKYQDRAPVERYAEQNYPQPKTMAQLEQEVRGILDGTYAPDEPRFSTEQTLRAYQAEQARKRAPLGPNRGLGATPAAPYSAPPTAPPIGEKYQERIVSNPSGLTREATPEGVAALDPADRAAFESYQRMQRYNPESVQAPSGVKTSVTPAEQAAVERPYQRMAMPTSGYGLPTNYNTDEETLSRLADAYRNAGIGVTPTSAAATSGRPRGAAATYTQSYDVPSNDEIDLTREAYNRERYEEVRPPVFSGDFSESSDQPGEGVAASVIPSKFNYPVKPDGTPYTAEDLQNLPPSVLSDYMDKVRFARMTDTPYPMTPAQREKAFVAKGLGRVISANPLTRAFVAGANLIGKGIRALPGEMGDEFGGGLADASGALRDPGAAVEAYETANPLRRVQMEVLAGEPNYIPGSKPPYSGTSYAGRIPTQEPGGKGNDFGSYSSGSYPSYSGGDYSTASAAEEGRPSQYYLWDLGIGVPSPGDPEYNDYQEYLKDRRTTA